MDPQRRLLVNASALAGVAGLIGARAVAQTSASGSDPALGAAQGPPPATGKPGDFDFLAGEWKISHRRLKDAKTGEWDRFEGEATVHAALDGVASFEELRIPARKFSGTGIRLLDVKRGLWADYWVNGRDGVLSPPPMWGSFVNGVGLFIADEVADGATIRGLGVWDRITPTTCRWRQTATRDGGKTWEPSWFMDWTRA